MIEDEKQVFRTLLNDWEWGDPPGFDLKSFHREACIDAANVALQEVRNELADHSLWLDIQNEKLVIVASLFDGELEAKQEIEDPFEWIALGEVARARELAHHFRKIADELDRIALEHA